MSVRKPEPPIDYRSPEPRTLEDLRKLTAYLRQHNVWLTEQLANAGGVKSFNGRTGVVVPTTGDYTPTQVGLGNVTNDAQLKRSANDFNTFTHKTAPVGADIVLFEDSANSGAKAYSTIAEFAAATNFRTGDPYLDPPANPNAANDEFTTDTLQSGVWSAWNFSDGVAVTSRQGDVDFLNNTLTAAQYRSSVVGSVLWVQFAAGKIVQMYKAATGDGMFAARVLVSTSQLVGPSVEFALATSGAGGRPTHAPEWSVLWNPDNRIQHRAPTTGTESDVFNQLFTEMGVLKHDSANNKHVSWHIDTRVNWQRHWTESTAANTNAFVVFEISSTGTSGNTVGRSPVGLDFFRRFPVTSWPAGGV